MLLDFWYVLKHVYFIKLFLAELLKVNYTSNSHVSSYINTKIDYVFLNYWQNILFYYQTLIGAIKYIHHSVTRLIPLYHFIVSTINKTRNSKYFNQGLTDILSYTTTISILVQWIYILSRITSYPIQLS